MYLAIILVGEMVVAEIKGFHEQNIMTCMKHFHGHGDTLSDSHQGYSKTQKTMEDMLEYEIIPFQKGINASTIWLWLLI